MKYCNNCNALISNDDKFCDVCGAKVAEDNACISSDIGDSREKNRTKSLDTIILASVCLGIAILFFIFLKYYIVHYTYNAVYSGYMDRICDADYRGSVSYYPKEIQDAVINSFNKDHVDIYTYSYNFLESSKNMYGVYPTLSYEITDTSVYSSKSVRSMENELQRKYGYSCKIWAMIRITSHVQIHYSNSSSYYDDYATLALIDGQWYVVGGFVSNGGWR